MSTGNIKYSFNPVIIEMLWDWECLPNNFLNLKCHDEKTENANIVILLGTLHWLALVTIMNIKTRGGKMLHLCAWMKYIIKH